MSTVKCPGGGQYVCSSHDCACTHEGHHSKIGACNLRCKLGKCGPCIHVEDDPCETASNTTAS
jgi:hypothetical protein